VKIAELDNPVRVGWLVEQGLRLDPRPYVSQAYAARAFLRRLPRTDPLHDVTEGRIFNAGRFRRQWTTDPAHGVPFLGSADIFEADLSWLPMLAKSYVEKNPALRLEPGWTLITCSGMTAGRVTYARPSMHGHACSQDVLRAVPAPGRIQWGYLYAFLASSFGIPVIKGGIYGTSVRHIEPHHIADLPVPRLGDEVETRIHALIEQAAELRERFQEGIVGATRDLFKSAGLAHLLDLRWNDQPRDLDFEVGRVRPISLRALNYAPRAQRILAELAAVPHRTLGDICAGGSLRTGARFKRIDAAPENGVRLIGQRQGFWLRPEGRWISRAKTPREVFVDNETVLISEHGLTGEAAIICRSTFAAGGWVGHAFTQDFLRVKSGSPDCPTPYLFALLRSEAVFRSLRSMLVGTGPQEINLGLCAQLPVPVCTVSARSRIAEAVRSAFRDRDEADRKEDEAMTLLDEAVREAAR
jgi:type I restriction enzyme S subunit